MLKNYRDILTSDQSMSHGDVQVVLRVTKMKNVTTMVHTALLITLRIHSITYKEDKFSQKI